jgi:hypothetical protein
MPYERVPYNVAADLTLDESPIIDLIEALGVVALSTAALEHRTAPAEAMLTALRERLARGVPNEGRPLPAPYVRLPLYRLRTDATALDLAMVGDGEEGYPEEYAIGPAGSTVSATGGWAPHGYVEVTGFENDVDAIGFVPNEWLTIIE